MSCLKNESQYTCSNVCWLFCLHKQNLLLRKQKGKTMKIYIYDYTDQYGKPHYNAIEISEEDANDWINIDYERRLSEALPGQVVEKRTAQQIQLILLLMYNRTFQL